ncbi:ankyrin repeat, SAM and basic leucine zipper domain-containing protein 1-like [Uloborus diversus]|uniref:ankyrin repeat, SAM and basic leucine zipper domain-containing protein 1-like n=1 Tax=Uloborus diversus TaxID=327109 RepID=UPI0024097922|nr:ankyrin repeat, SAM and basic leucine zipper domain-containing protein 1-like [Uloborus diversus]
MDHQQFSDLFPDCEEYLLDLHTSASIGCDERIQDIIESCEDKAIINQQNKEGWTPLMYATSCANLKVVLFLLEEGAITSTKNTFGLTALMLASKCGSVDVVNLLIDFGATVNEKDQNGWTALFHAVELGHRSVVQLLMEKGANVNLCEYSEKLTPLMVAVSAGHEVIAKDLLSYGVNPASESKKGETASVMAQKHGFFKLKNLIDAHLHSKNNHVSRLECTDLQTFLQNLQLSKYYHYFEKQGIDLSSFWMLTEEELKAIGIELLGPRKKMCKYISLHQNQTLNRNPEGAAYINQLLFENKKLCDELSKVKSILHQEKELKAAAENNLGKGIHTLKTFTCTVKRSLCYTMLLEEELRKNFTTLKTFLNNLPGKYLGTKSKTDSLYLLLESMDKLINDIQHQTTIALKQTDFRH